MSKVWFVTGASSGIGAAVAKAALQAGHRVVATARNLEKLRSVLGELASDQLALVQLDVSSETQATKAIEDADADKALQGGDRRGLLNALVRISPPLPQPPHPPSG